MKPWEFDRFTWGEFDDMLEGYEKRDEMAWQKTATLACWIINPHLKRKVTPDKLLGRQAEQRKLTPEEKRAEIEAVKARFKGVE